MFFFFQVHLFIFKINVFIYLFLFIYFWLHWVFVAARGLSLVAVSRGCSSLRCTGFSLWWLLLLWSTGSRCTGFSSCGLRALERRLSSCGARAYFLRGMWDPPGPGLELMSPALAGGFVTTAPPGKSGRPLYSYFIIGSSFLFPWRQGLGLNDLSLALGKMLGAL